MSACQTHITSLFSSQTNKQTNNQTGTAIYTGIVAACDLLAVEARKHPNADLRVVVLTDGQNNVNTHTVDDAVRRLADVGAVCDAVLVGDCCDEGLRRLVSATEGECFQVRRAVTCVCACVCVSLCVCVCVCVCCGGGGVCVCVCVCLMHHYFSLYCG
jgi:hypothetical protein